MPRPSRASKLRRRWERAGSGCRGGAGPAAEGTDCVPRRHGTRNGVPVPGPGAGLFPWQWVSLCRAVCSCSFGCNARAPGWGSVWRSAGWRDSRLENGGCALGPQAAVGGSEGGFPCLGISWFKSKLDVFHVQNRLLKVLRRYWRWLCNRLCLHHSCPVTELICVKDSTFFPPTDSFPHWNSNLGACFH